MKRRGAVCLSLEALQALLHLRPGLTVTGASFEPMSETVTIYLAGDSLRETGKREYAVIFPLTELMEEFR